MADILNEKDFGLKIYNKFPPKYREDDAMYNFALRRYLEALSDGGFSPVISDINGILNLKNPKECDISVLYLLYEELGFNWFNGIPETYLRYFLPNLEDAWERKGAISVIEYIVAVLSGISVQAEVVYEEGVPSLIVTWEISDELQSEFPDVTQMGRIIKDFIPFFVSLHLTFHFDYVDSVPLNVREDRLDEVYELTDNFFDYDRSFNNPECVFNSTLLFNNGSGDVLRIQDDHYDDEGITIDRQGMGADDDLAVMGLFTNSSNSFTNNARCLIPIFIDEITVNGTKTALYPSKYNISI